MSFQENIDTSSPLGSAIFTIISAVAQLERDIIAETGQSGPQAGQELRKTARPAATPVKVDRETAPGLREQGQSTRQIVRELDIAKTTLLRLLKGLWSHPAKPESLKAT